MDHLDWLAVIATTIFAGFIAYDVILIRRNDVHHNPTTQLIFLGASFLSSSSYFLITRDFARAFTPLVAIVCMSVVYYFTVRQQGRFVASPKGKFQRAANYFVLVFSALTAVLWVMVRFIDASAANILMQIIVSVGYAPLIAGLVKGEQREKWFIWLPISFAIQSYIAWAKFDGDWVPLFAPVRGTIFCALIAALALIYPNKHLIRARS